MVEGITKKRRENTAKSRLEIASKRILVIATTAVAATVVALVAIVTCISERFANEHSAYKTSGCSDCDPCASTHAATATTAAWTIVVMVDFVRGLLLRWVSRRRVPLLSIPSLLVYHGLFLNVDDFLVALVAASVTVRSRPEVVGDTNEKQHDEHTDHNEDPLL